MKNLLYTLALVLLAVACSENDNNDAEQGQEYTSFELKGVPSRVRYGIIKSAYLDEETRHFRLIADHGENNPLEAVLTVDVDSVHVFYYIFSTWYKRPAFAIKKNIKNVLDFYAGEESIVVPTTLNDYTYLPQDSTLFPLY